MNRMGENFARVENKYLISVSQASALEKGLQRQGFCRSDFGSAKVQSLYYDTADCAVIRSSLERPAYKEKLRLRAYGEPGALTQTFLEIKKKYNGVVYKRRTALPLRDTMRGLSAGVLPEAAGQVGNEALWLVRRYGLVPGAVIAYDRDAWFNRDEPGVRITLDRNLTFRNWDMDLNLQTGNLPIIPAGQRLLEVKTGGTYPLWLVRLLNEVGARRTHFSKYGQAYQLYIQPEKEEIERSGFNCSTASLSKGA